MSKVYDKSIIRDFINEGYELERLSVEFQIPMTELQKIKLELEHTKIRNLETRRKGNSQKTFSKMEEMRRRYISLIGEDKKAVSKEKTRLLSKEENQMIEKIINDSKQLLQLSKSNPLYNLKINEFFKNIKKLEKLPLTLEQLEQLRDIINNEFFKNLGNKNLYPIYRKSQKIVMDKFLESIDELLNETYSIESLKEVLKKLSGTYEMPYKMSIEVRKRKIENQISKLVQERAINSIENRCSKDIINIASQLASGACDIKSAKKIIDAETEKLQEQSEKTKLSATYEQTRNRLYSQIKTLIRENSENYPIEDPIKVLNQMMNLFDCNFEETLPCIIDNMLVRNEFEKTNKFIDGISKKFSNYKPIRILKRKVKTAEIGYIIGKGLMLQGTPEEEQAYVELIEGGLEKYQLDPKSIIVGTSKDGKKITLSDVMPVQRTK